MSQERQVVVVGGGVIGAACAHFLVQSGWRVLVLDKGRFGHACSHANCGFVCPSHVLPLAAPGAVWGTLKALLRRDSPFKIRPGLRLGLWRWLAAFARRCNERDMLESARGIQPLLMASRRLYDELVRDGLECEWQTRGLLFVFHSRQAMEHYASTDELLRKEFNAPARPYFGTEVCELEPALKKDLGGGWLYEADAHLRPDRLLDSWRRRLEALGVVIRENCTVQGVVGTAGRAGCLRTSGGDVPGDAFVLAAGALTPFLNRGLGCRIPIQPGKGYSLTTSLPVKCPKLPLIFEEHRVAATPFQNGFRLGSMMEFVGYNESIRPQRIDYLQRAARQYLDEPIGSLTEEIWYGWRPMTPDSRPIIGPSPAFANVIIAAGHNMLGLSMAPATGQLVAALLNREQPAVDPQPYSPARY